MGAGDVIDAGGRGEVYSCAAILNYTGKAGEASHDTHLKRSSTACHTSLLHTELQLHSSALSQVVLRDTTPNDFRHFAFYFMYRFKLHVLCFYEGFNLQWKPFLTVQGHRGASPVSGPCTSNTFLSCLQELKDFVWKGLTIKLILIMKLYQFVYSNLHVNVNVSY